MYGAGSRNPGSRLLGPSMKVHTEVTCQNHVGIRDLQVVVVSFRVHMIAGTIRSRVDEGLCYSSPN